MKKLLSLLLIFTIISCGSTSLNQDLEMLQKKYPESIIYRINGSTYIICDSVNVYEISVGHKGNIKTTIKIK